MQGQIFESFNIAALWDLPCIFVCENNHYGEQGCLGWATRQAGSGYFVLARGHALVTASDTAAAG